MREKIIEAMFEMWCDGACELRKYSPDYEKVFNVIRKRIEECSEECCEIENAICNLVCECERNAFMNGVYICLQLMNGNILREGMSE